jgi:hypothetical protein
MRTDSIRRRLAALDSKPEADEELEPIVFQWLNNDGTPLGPEIKRLVAKGRFAWMKSIPNDDE